MKIFRRVRRNRCVFGTMGVEGKFIVFGLYLYQMLMMVRCYGVFLIFGFVLKDVVKSDCCLRIRICVVFNGNFVYKKVLLSVTFYRGIMIYPIFFHLCSSCTIHKQLSSQSASLLSR